MQAELSREEINALIEHHKRIFENAESKVAEWAEVSHIAATRMNNLAALRTHEERIASAQEDFKDVFNEVFEYVYSSQMTVVKKTEFALKHITKKISSTREIAEAIKQREEFVPAAHDKVIQTTTVEHGALNINADGNSFTPHSYQEHKTIGIVHDVVIMPELDLSDLISKLGATLKQKIDKGDTFFRSEIDGTWYYGLNEWMDKKGKVKNEYSR